MKLTACGPASTRFGSALAVGVADAIGFAAALVAVSVVIDSRPGAPPSQATTRTAITAITAHARSPIGISALHWV
jgi:hypothetical protein